MVMNVSRRIRSADKLDEAGVVIAVIAITCIIIIFITIIIIIVDPSGRAQHETLHG